MNLYLDDKKSSVAEICKALGINQNSIPRSSRIKKFERVGVKDTNGKIKLDPQSKKPIIPSSLVIKTSFNAQLEDGSSAKITYSKGQRPRTQGGVTELIYDDLYVQLKGLSMTIKEEEQTLFFFLFIHNYNTTSPLNNGKLNPRVEYSYVDDEANANKLNDKEDELVEALILFKNMGLDQIRQLAKGYKVADNIDNLSENEIRNAVRAKIKEDAAKFLLDMNHNTVAFEGIIRDAMDKKVLTSRDTQNGKAWSVQGIEFTETTNNIDPVPSLLSAVEAQMDKLFPLIQKGIEKVGKAETLTKPSNDQFFVQFKTKTDVQFNKDDEKTLLQAKQQEDWIAKLREYASLDVNDPALNHKKREAMIKHKDAIEAQRAKDLAAKEAETV